MVNTTALFAIVLSSLSAQPRGEILDFGLTYCIPCQQMAPIVEKLAAEGHPIRKVDGQQEPQLADRFGVTRYPTVILLIDGKEVRRHAGVLSEADLRGMLAMIPRTEAARPASAPAAAAPPGAGANNRNATASNAASASGPFRSVLGESAPLPRPQVREAEAPKATAQASESGGGRAGGLWPFSKKNAAPPEVRGSSENLTQPPAVEAPAGQPADLFATNARIRVRMGDKVNLGSGTIIESNPGQTLIMTCGHIFRGITEDAKIEVDIAPWDKPRTTIGTLIRHDLDADVGLIAIRSDQTLPVSPVARRSSAPRVGEPMVCIGCSGGAVPTSEQVRVTAIDKYEGAATIECTGLPVQGRSGGGLFDSQGRLVGACIHADPAAQRGIYAGLQAIHDLLTQAGFAHLHTDRETQVAQADPPAAPKAAAPAAPVRSQAPSDLGSSDPFQRDSASTPGAGSAFAQSSPAEPPRDFAFQGGTARPLDVAADDAEIVVIVRQKGKPQAPDRVILINQASPKFFQYLQGELSPNSAPGLSSAERPTYGRDLAPALAGSTPPRSTPNVPAVGGTVDMRASKAGLPQTTLSEKFEPRAYVRKK